MPRIPLPTEFYALESYPENSADLMNMYAEPVPPGSRGNPIAQSIAQQQGGGPAPGLILRSVPGLVPQNVLTSAGNANLVVGAGPSLAMNGDLPGTIYVASGTHAYRVTFGATTIIADLGSIGSLPAGYSIGNPAKIVTIAVGVLAVVFCNPPNAYQCLHTASALTQITDPSYPGADSVAYLDGRFAFSLGDELFSTNLLDAATFDALSFSYADSVPNTIQRVFTHMGELWMMGYNGIEVFYDAGLANFPFVPRSGANITHGCRNAATVCECDNSVFWLGSDGIVYRNNGYQPLAVSNFAVENWMRRHADYERVDAWSYTQSGHWYYVLNFFGAGENGAGTLTYDATTKLWHRRSSSSDGTGVYRGCRAAQLADVALVGDRTTGVIFGLQPETAQNFGVMPLVQMVCPPLYAATLRRFMNRLELEMDLRSAGNSAVVMLDYSDDCGVTWSTPRPPSSQSGNRLFWTRIGSFRERILRFTFSGQSAVYGLDDMTEDAVS